ncbi:Hypothetical predicted protein [Paramuricea clavata]|uniref:Uncharacterized protein n=1 Tax=Paramuricea clavata TaxID=317549 RepID=A0A6S7I5E9_PARCT|nr:Hypothetical predicted protein [Paramuricea clavata]
MMKKITTYIKDGGFTLNLRDPPVLTHESKLFVRAATVFWNYKNVRADYNDYISVDGKKVMMDEGYWTFKQLRKKIEENGLTFKEYPDGKIKIDLDNRTKTVRLRNLTGILGYRYTPHISDRPVNIHDGLRYITVTCDLVNHEHNIGPDENRSTIITSLPIDGANPLFGIVTKYNDIESQLRVDAGSIGGQYAWYRFPNSITYPPNSYKTDDISKSDVDNTKFIGFAMTDGSNPAPTMGATLSFSTNSAGNIVLHIKNGNGLIRATFMYFITQHYLGCGGITIQVMSF